MIFHITRQATTLYDAICSQEVASEMLGLGLLCHIGVQDLKEPKIVGTRFDVVFTQDRCRLVVVDCGLYDAVF